MVVREWPALKGPAVVLAHHVKQVSVYPVGGSQLHIPVANMMAVKVAKAAPVPRGVMVVMVARPGKVEWLFW
jgi:hypothetical protein